MPIQEELEEVLMFVMSSACIDQEEDEDDYDDEDIFDGLEKNFERFRPVMTFFQTALLKTDFSEYDDDISEMI